MFVVFVFMSLSSQKSILTCLLFFWLMLKLYHFRYGSIVDYFILFCRDYYLVLFLLFFFSFCFIFLLVLLSPFKFYLILCCICCLISYLRYCIYYHFISLFIPRNPLSQKCEKKTNRFILFSSRHIWKHVLMFLLFVFF